MKGVGSKYLRKHTNILYLFKSVGLRLVKIGISCDPINRLNKLNESIIDKGEYFTLVDFVQFKSSGDAIYYEKVLHNRFKEQQVLTEILGAKTECFDISILSSATAEILTARSFSFYDPFIFVDDVSAEEILGISWRDYCASKNIKTDFKMNKIKNIFRNLAANIVVSNKTYLHYHKNFMSDLGVASGTTFDVFKDFAPPYCLVDFNLTREYTIKVKGMDLIKRCLNFRKYKAHHFLKIYSLTKADLVHKRHLAYKTAVFKYFGLQQVMGSADNCIVEVK